MAKLVRKTPFQYKGKVHDLTVSESHSYNIEGLGVHNSAGGSLLSYVLNITQLDPIQHGLLFERFLTRFKKGFPDIDCLSSNVLVKMTDGTYAKINKLMIGDLILDHYNNEQMVLAVKERSSTDKDIVYNVFTKKGDIYGSFVSTSKHRLLDENGNAKQIEDFNPGDKMHRVDGHHAIFLEKELVHSPIMLTDITVAQSATFQFVPFNCCKFETNEGDYLVSISNYSYDTDLYYSVLKENYYGRVEQDSRIIKL